METEKKTIQGFWASYNSSRCKTVMAIISVLITSAFIFDQIWGNQNSDLAKGFSIIIGYWIGRGSKVKDK